MALFSYKEDWPLGTCADDFRIPSGVAEALIGLVVAIVTAAIYAVSESEDD